MNLDIGSFMVVVLSTAITFGLFSILTGVDNPFFAWAENIYVGGAVGMTIVVSFTWIVSNLIQKIVSNPSANWPLIISLILGLMMLLRVHPKYSYLARIPISIATGVGVAVSTRAIIFSGLLYQIRATILPILYWREPATAFTNLMIVVFVITILTFFIYTTELKGPLKVSSRIGRLALFASFGALFAQTYMGRLGLFLGRMETLLIPETNFRISIVVALFMLITIIVLKNYYPETLKKLVP
ncbi:hypothetical protein KEJ13_09575 [Candidatus Bathyarchaeota archaeon]|nr:hypothetical protein [Candidatus Bathyarchaeota archaeon]